MKHKDWCGTCRQVEVQHHGKSLPTWGSWWKCRSVTLGDPNILKMAARLYYCQGQKWWWSGASLNKDDRLYVLWQALRRSPEDHWQIPVIEHWLIYTDRVDFALFRFVTLSWIFPFRKRKYLFCFYRNP